MTGTDDHTNIQAKQGLFRIMKGYMQRRRLGDLLVISGHINPRQLRAALHTYKTQNTALPFGRFLIRHNYITRRNLAGALVRQHILRGITAAVALFISLSAFSQKQTRAGAIRDIPARISLTRTFMDMAPIRDYPSMFGYAEKRSGNLEAFTKWHSMFDRFESEISQNTRNEQIRQWRAAISEFQSYGMEEMVRRVNSYVNATDYIKDKNNWGRSDYWATPAEFFNNGGDCEDYAIAKYASLRMLGLPEERLRIVIVHDKLKDIPHALLVVYTGNGGLVLDNQREGVRQLSSIERYKPIFSINRQAWWLHSRPTTTVVAAAE